LVENVEKIEKIKNQSLFSLRCYHTGFPHVLSHFAHNRTQPSPKPQRIKKEIKDKENGEPKLKTSKHPRYANAGRHIIKVIAQTPAHPFLPQHQ
jgi:hypothetical protein